MFHFHNETVNYLQNEFYLLQKYVKEMETKQAVLKSNLEIDGSAIIDM